MSEIHKIALMRLRDDGQRLTSARQSVLDALSEAGVPMTIPAILTKQPGLAQSSLYRNLAILEAAGLVSKISMGDEHSHYELAEELTQHHHHHLVCTECGQVDDVTLSLLVEQALDRALHDVAQAHGFQLSAHRLDLVGRCANCATD